MAAPAPLCSPLEANNEISSACPTTATRACALPGCFWMIDNELHSTCEQAVPASTGAPAMTCNNVAWENHVCYSNSCARSQRLVVQGDAESISSAHPSTQAQPSVSLVHSCHAAQPSTHETDVPRGLGAMCREGVLPSAYHDLRPRTPLQVPPLRTRTCGERFGWSTEEDKIMRAIIHRLGNKWNDIADLLPGRSPAAVRNRWNRIQEERSHSQEGGTELGAGASSCRAASNSEPPRVRYTWQEDEDRLILSGVNEHGRKWRKVGARLPGRTEQAVRNRYYRLAVQLQSSAIQGSWTAEEDACILTSVAELGNSWLTIARRLPNRTDNAIRNRYIRLQREQERSTAPAK